MPETAKMTTSTQIIEMEKEKQNSTLEKESSNLDQAQSLAKHFPIQCKEIEETVATISKMEEDLRLVEVETETFAATKAKEKEKLLIQIELETKEIKLVKLQNKTKKFEDFITKRHAELSDKKNSIKIDLEKMTKKLSVLQKSNQNEQLSKMKEKWLEDVIESLQEKAAELECPVCLETCCSPPLYMCSNGHLICSKCSPACKNCPKCRVDYNKPIIRNRMAEKMCEEVQKLTQKREDIFLFE